MTERDRRKAKQTRRQERRGIVLSTAEQQAALENRTLMRVQILSGAAVGGLAVFSQSYGIHGVEQLSSYGKDFLAPLVVSQGVQGFSKLLRDVLHIPLPRKLGDSPTPYIGAALFYAYAFETMQYQGKQMGLEEISQGRFDPNDLLAATAGAFFAYKASRWLNRKTLQIVREDIPSGQPKDIQNP